MKASYSNKLGDLVLSQGNTGSTPVKAANLKEE